MIENMNMSDIYAQLFELGLNQEFVRENGLPSWWDDELNHKPLAVLEGAGYIADRFGLDFKSLLSSDEKLKFKSQYQTKFNHHFSPNNHLQIAQGLAARIVEMVVYGTEETNFIKLPSNQTEIRAEIVNNYGNINLISLLDYCWQKGIIVVYFNHFPENIKTFDSLIQFHLKRPVIMLSSPYQDPEKLAFYLVYELGHLALGHIQEGILIDEKIDFNSKEDQIHQFAVNLLRDNQIHNPGANGQQIINQYLAEKLDWDKFDDDSYEYLEKVLGV